MRNVRVHVLYCEDVRRELGNKASYMGVYGPIVLGPGETFMLEKVVVAAILKFPAADADKIQQMGVEVKLHKVDGTEVVLQSLDPKPTKVVNDVWFGEYVAEQGLDGAELQAVALITLRNLLVDQPCQLKVKVVTNAGEIAGKPLLLAPAKEGLPLQAPKRVAKKPTKTLRRSAKKQV